MYNKSAEKNKKQFEIKPMQKEQILIASHK